MDLVFKVETICIPLLFLLFLIRFNLRDKGTVTPRYATLKYSFFFSLKTIPTNIGYKKIIEGLLFVL